MDTDDLEPVKKSEKIDFDTLSVEELREYIEELKAEIAKAENFIQSKQGDKLKAEELFKKWLIDTAWCP